MKTMMRSCATIPVALFVAALAVAAPVAAQDKAKPAAAAEKSKPAASNQKVLFENDKVKAFEVRYKPGEGTDVRERPGRLVRALSDGTMMRTYADGKTQKVEWKAGDTRWFPKEVFGNKNAGKSEMVLYVVEPK